MREYREWYEQYTDSLGDQRIRSNRLFIKETGDPIYPSTIEFWVDKVCQTAGLPPGRCTRCGIPISRCRSRQASRR